MRARAKAAAVGLGLTVAFGASAGAGAASCVTKDEQAAILVRLLQNEMMVAALSCRGPDYPQRYGAFVRKHEKQLIAHAEVLKRYYRRLYGASATHQLDKYVSVIANEASLRSMTQADFCTAISDVYNTALRVDHRDLPDVAAGQSFSASAPQACVPANKPRTPDKAGPVQAAATPANGKKK